MSGVEDKNCDHRRHQIDIKNHPKERQKNIQIDRQIISEVTLTQLAWFTSAVILVKYAGQLDFLRQNKKIVKKLRHNSYILLVLREEEGADTSFEC